MVDMKNWASHIRTVQFPEQHKIKKSLYLILKKEYLQNIRWWAENQVALTVRKTQFCSTGNPKTNHILFAKYNTPTYQNKKCRRQTRQDDQELFRAYFLTNVWQTSLPHHIWRKRLRLIHHISHTECPPWISKKGLHPRLELFVIRKIPP